MSDVDDAEVFQDGDGWNASCLTLWVAVDWLDQSDLFGTDAKANPTLPLCAKLLKSSNKVPDDPMTPASSNYVTQNPLCKCT